MLNGKHRQPFPGPLCASYAHALPVLDDLTDTRLAADTFAHLAGCAWCRAQRATYDRFDKALRLHFAPDATPFFSIQGLEAVMPDVHDILSTNTPHDDTEIDDDSLRLTVSPLPIPPRQPQTPKRPWRVVTGAAGLAAVLVISLLAGLIFMSHGRAVPPASHNATPAVAPGSQTSLMAIGMSSPTDGWAMGTQIPAGHNGGSGDDPAYVLHFTGGRWVQAQTPIRAWITAIKMLSPTDGWAIGNRVYHYDGVSWREVNLPIQTQFNAIAAVSPNDIWIAGDGTWSGATDGNMTILHYDGKVWTWQATPSLGDFFSITSLSMISAQEGWAIGSATLDGSKGWYPPTGAILHYVNGSWSLAKTLPGMNLQTISMGSATDGWAGGRLVTYSKTGPLPEGQSPDETDTPKLWRYTGNQWVEVSVPRSSLIPAGIQAQGQVNSITMLSATDGWMLAGLDSGLQSLDQSTTLGPDVFHLEQGRWVQIQGLSLQQRRSAYMTQVEFLSPDEFWGVGSSFWWTGIPSDFGSGYTPTVTPLIVHYNNGVWTFVEK